VRIVGVDGGASSTRCLVVDENGHILGYGVGGPSNHKAMRLQNACKEIFHSAFPGEEYPSVESLCFGKAGILREQVVEAIVKKYVNPKHLYICGDMKIALAGASLGQPGILVYAGTGANTYGVDEAGNEVQVGGWGYLIDDEGAGYAIGRQALKQVFRAEDGRGKPTILREKLLLYFGCATLRELLDKVYQDEGLPRSEIAALSKLVAEAAEEGDQVAQEILAWAGRTLAETAIVALRKLGKIDQTFVIYPAGGVFRAGRWILEPFTEALHQGAPLAKVESPHFPPVVGAVFLALGILNLRPNDAFLNNLKNELGKIKWLNNY